MPTPTVREPLVYTLDGNGPSFVRDTWSAFNAPASREGQDAYDRLRKFSAQTADRTRFANAGNVTDQSALIPPGYRAEEYVGQVPSGRVLWNACTTGTLTDATPFKIPAWVGSSGMSGTNSENVGPSSGTVTNATYVTVTPTAQSGEFIVSREIADSSNPGIDVIAWNAMAEEYASDVETMIATALAGVTDDNVGGRSTEGCYVAAISGNGLDLGTQIATTAGTFIAHRHAPAAAWLAGSTATAALAAAIDDVGRPVFPFVNGGAGLNVSGLNATTAWALTNGTDDAIGWGPGDVRGWESPGLMLRFEEKSGPESIALHRWGYVGVAIVRAPGIHSVAFTAA